MTTTAPMGRGAVLFVVQASESMARPVPACGGRSSILLALDAVRHTLHRLTGQGLWDVAVIACRGEEPLLPLLPGSALSRPFVQLERLSPGSLTGITVSASGTPHPAMAGVGQALARLWLASQPAPARPLVVLLCDEQAPRKGLARLARSLRHLTTLYGRACLAVCGFSPKVQDRILFPAPADSSPPAPWESWLEVVSAAGDWRWLSLNTDPSRLLARNAVKLFRQRDGAAAGWRFDGRAGPRCEARLLHAPKEGNAEEEWEDALAADPARGVAAAADGASEGIFSRAWASLLVEQFLTDPPDLASASELDVWVGRVSKAWRAGLHYDTLPPLYQDKVDETGAGATLATVGLEAIDGQHHRWRAVTVGDACLFWIRDGKNLLSFPLARSLEFGSSPDLVRTLVGHPVRIVRAEGRGKLGDLYALATDAVAQLIIRYSESGKEAPWDKLWEWDAAMWQEAVRQWRQAGRLANDDSSLLLLKVTG